MYAIGVGEQYVVAISHNGDNVLRAVLKHVPSRNMFQIGMVYRSEKCAFLKHVLDFVISKMHAKCKVLKYKHL